MSKPSHICMDGRGGQPNGKTPVKNTMTPDRLQKTTTGKKPGSK